jgi:hypothetical protein
MSKVTGAEKRGELSLVVPKLRSVQTAGVVHWCFFNEGFKAHSIGPNRCVPYSSQ